MKNGIDIARLQKNVKSGKFAAIYLFYGEEDLLVDEAVDLVVKHAVDADAAEFNFDLFYGADADGARIFQTASSYPFIAERRVVVVRELHKMNLKKLEPLAKYTDSPSPTTCLILAAGKVDARNKWLRKIKSNAITLECKRLYDNQLPNWIKSRVKANGFSIDEEAVRLLHANTGNSLRDLLNELDKIYLNLNEKKEITITDIQDVVGVSREFSVFELSNYLGERKLSDTLRVLGQMLENGEPAGRILAMLLRHFVILNKVKYGMLAGQSQREIQAAARVSPYFLKDYILQTKNFSSRALQQAFHFFLTADIALKSSGQKPRLILEMLIYSLITS